MMISAFDLVDGGIDTFEDVDEILFACIYNNCEQVLLGKKL